MVGDDLARDLKSAIDDYLRTERLTQQQLGKLADVDQTTISRARSREAIRAGPAYQRLCKFMQQAGYLGGPDASTQAIKQVWDGSQPHDEALAALILATKDLWPDLGEGTLDGAK